MPSYRRIETADDLRESDKEGESLDFKTTIADPRHEWKELAKDVAAFANHLGGVLLVGAREQPDGTASYDGLPRDFAEKVAVAYERAGLQKCVPRQTVRARLLTRPNNKFIVAVNVEPSPLFVAAEYPTKSDIDSGGTAWRFPIRRGRDTVYLSPELLPMFLDAKTRRSSVLLGQLEGHFVNVVWRRPPAKGPALRYRHCRVVSAELLLNAVHLTGESSAEKFSVHIPFDDVEAVWGEVHTVAASGKEFRVWHLRVSGYVLGSWARSTTQAPAARRSDQASRACVRR
jgi:Putative DNA-binding domain